MGDGMPASLTAPRTGGKAAFHLVQVISGHQIRLAMSLWFVGRLIDQFEAEVIVVPIDQSSFVRIGGTQHQDPFAENIVSDSLCLVSAQRGISNSPPIADNYVE